ncbi:MAG: bifunctional phosphoribosylaminoimidazolecarboxamide formyltransferase/IMP cyclohydrolase [Gemmatimonadota bacterium]
MRTALLSVSDKTGIVELARALDERGWRILSTGGTARELRSAGLAVVDVAEYTGFPEILGGRVKTLHPAVHGGLLARRAHGSDERELTRLGFGTIDLVAVNLYPFRATVARPSATLAEALEQIDIGGPTMLRAAAKNHTHVWAVCDPADYEPVTAALDSSEDQTELRRRLAAKVFRHTAAYDAAVAAYLRPDEPAEDAAFPEEILVPLARAQTLRYGENPDQRAAFYRASGAAWGLPSLRQLHGKELSFNNLLDLDGALSAIAPFLDADRAACAILKHTTPCGIAWGRSAIEAFRRALACDPVSAFGSTVVFSEPVTETAAEALSELFVECLLAPGYAAEALRILSEKKNLRILGPRPSEHLETRTGHIAGGLEARGVRGGILLQTPPAPARPADFRAGARVGGACAPVDEEWEELAFAWAAVQSVKSNAIVLARDGATIGIGAGQMSRIDAVRLAVQKARDAGHGVPGAVLASDAFFPFRDGVDEAAAAGVRAIVQPGGSVRDEEVVGAADGHGIAMVLTGRRTFRH